MLQQRDAITLYPLTNTLYWVDLNKRTMNMTFAIPNNCNILEIKVLVRKVKTKAWVNLHLNSLLGTADKLTSVGCDNRHVIAGMLMAAYGCNIGQQIEQKLTDNDIIKIRDNLLVVIIYK